MNKEQILNEMKALTDKATKENRGFTPDEERAFGELEARMEVLNKEERAKKIEEELRAIRKPEEKNEDANEVRSMLVRAITEKRAITVNGAGASAYVRDVIMAAIEKADWLSKLDYMIAANATTTIPVLAPIPANMLCYAEGSTSVSADSTAVLTGKTLSLHSYISLLPVSKAAMAFSEIGRQIDKVYQRVFLNTLHEEVVTGSGTYSFVGLDVVTGKTAVSTDAVSLTGLINIAITAKSKLTNPIILINPTAFSTILSANIDKSIIAAIFQTMQVYGVPIFFSSNLADGNVSDDVWCVAFEPENYAVAIAAELAIDTINVKGDANTYFQAYMFADGKEKVSAEVYYNKYTAE